MRKLAHCLRKSAQVQGEREAYCKMFHKWHHLSLRTSLSRESLQQPSPDLVLFSSHG
jgi:hypothetical protein